MAFDHGRVRKGLWLKISEEERNGYIAAMKENNVPSGTSSPGKIKYMFPDVRQPML